MKIYKFIILCALCAACATHKDTEKIVQDNTQTRTTNVSGQEQSTEVEKLSAEVAIMEFDPISSDSNLHSVKPPLKRVIIYNPTFTKNFEALKGFNLQTTDESSSSFQKSEKEYKSNDHWLIVGIVISLVLMFAIARLLKK